MRQSELQLEHAFNSVTLIHAIRTVLTSVPSDRVEWSKEVLSLVNQIVEILKHEIGK